MNSEAIVLTSSQPLPNKMQNFKKLYLVELLVMCAGVFTTTLFAIGVLALLITYIADELLTSFHRDKLRTVKFRYGATLTQEELFAELQKALVAKYGGKMLLEKSEDGVISVSYDTHIYDVHIGEDGSFTLWWRKSIKNAFFSFSKYTSYKKILAAYGMIVFEIQEICNAKGEC